MFYFDDEETNTWAYVGDDSSIAEGVRPIWHSMGSCPGSKEMSLFGFRAAR